MGTLATKSLRVVSERSISETSCNTATAPPPGMGAALTSKILPGETEVARRRLAWRWVRAEATAGEHLGVANGMHQGAALLDRAAARYAA